MTVIDGMSLVVPVIIAGLPEEIEVLGRRWQRKREFHVTAASADVIERAGGGRDDTWDRVTRAASGRSIGRIRAREEIRRVRHPDRPDLETLVVMVDAPGLADLHRSLSETLDADLHPPPAHVTVYSTDPTAGIGIDDEQQLGERAPALSADEQDEVRRAMRFDELLWDDEGIPPADELPQELALGRSDNVFTPPVLAALAYAAHVHHQQRRRGTDTPYLAHLISVAALVAEDGGTPIEVIAALLHDAAEDHGGDARLDDIDRRFGAEVRAIVAELTDPPGEAWRTRKERYLARLRAEERAEVLRVSNADKLHNARAILADRRTLGDGVFERMGKSREDLLWYYGQLAATFAERRPQSQLATELSATVAALGQQL
jgi:HD domain